MRWCWTILLLTRLAALGHAQGHSSHEILAEARTAYNSLDDRKALSLLEDFLVHEPYHQEARLLHARALMQLGRHEAAVASLESLPELGESGQLLLAESLAFVPERRDEAWKLLDSMLLRDPDGLRHRVVRAKCLLAVGRIQEATGEIWAARQMVVRNKEIDYIQGRVFEAQGRVAEARELYAGIIDKREQYPPADPHIQKNTMYGLGRLAMAAGQYELAQNYYEQIVNVLPDDAYAHFQYSVSLGMKDRFELALAEMEKAVELAPEDVFLRYRLGDLFRSQRKVDEAIAQFERMLELTEEVTTPRLRLAELFLERGDEDKARTNIEIALKVSPESGDVQETAGQVYEALGELELATAAYEKALQLSSLKYNAMYRLALLLRHSENEDDQLRAREYLARHQKIEPEWPNIIRTRAELDVNPRSGELMARVAYFLNRAEELEPAWEWIQKALQADPRLPRTHIFAGYIANNRGAPDVALRHFEQAAALIRPEPMDPTIQGYIDALKRGEALPLLQ